MIQAALIFQTLLFCVPFSFVEAGCRKPYVRPTMHTSFEYLFSNNQIRREFFSSFAENSPRLMSIKAIEVDRTHLPQSKEKYDGTLTFMCRRKDGHFSLFELQSIHNFYSSTPLLIYAAEFYNQQACKKNPKKIKEINRIGILNGKPAEPFLKFSFSMDGIQFRERCLVGSAFCRLTEEQTDWQAFFQSGPHTSESWVKEEIKTPIVRKAFDMMRFDKLPKEVKREYLIEHKSYRAYGNGAKKTIKAVRQRP